LGKDSDLDLNAISHAVIAAAYEVSNQLGCGFLEKVYERSLLYELKLLGLKADTQVPLRVVYKEQTVGDFFADILVENQTIVELKCVDSFTSVHVAQCLNYLRATGLHLSLLLNFQKPKLEIRRVVLDA
jgi:GxxExxY protein